MSTSFCEQNRDPNWAARKREEVHWECRGANTGAKRGGRNGRGYYGTCKRGCTPPRGSTVTQPEEEDQIGLSRASANLNVFHVLEGTGRRSRRRVSSARLWPLGTLDSAQFTVEYVCCLHLLLCSGIHHTYFESTIILRGTHHDGLEIVRAPLLPCGPVLWACGRISRLT